MHWTSLLIHAFPWQRIISREIVATSWWDTKDSLHVVQATTFHKKAIVCSSESPFAYIGFSSVNMKNTLSAVTIKGDMFWMSPADGKSSERKIDHLGGCVTTGAALGPVLAVAEGVGSVRVYNHDADMMQTCQTVSLGTRSATLQMEISRGTEVYHLICACRDGMLRVYDIPWSVAHSRYSGTLSSISALDAQSVVKLPSWLSDIGRILSYRDNIVVLMDVSMSSCALLDLSSARIISEFHKIGSGVQSVYVEDDVLYLQMKGNKKLSVHLQHSSV